MEPSYFEFITGKQKRMICFLRILLKNPVKKQEIPFINNYSKRKAQYEIIRLKEICKSLDLIK